MLSVCLLTPGLSTNSIHQSMNAFSGVLHKFCTTFIGALDSAWQSLLINRQACDFFLKMMIVLEGMVSLTSDTASNNDLADICARLVPLAGSSLNGNLTAQWQEECGISDEIIVPLVPLPVANGSSLAKENQKFTAFFDINNMDKQFDINKRIALAVETIEKMSTYATDASDKCAVYLVDMLKDWSNAKGVTFEMDTRIDAEKEKLRKQLELRMNAMARDVAKVNKLYEQSLDKNAKADVKIKELQKYEMMYRETVTKLEESEFNVGLRDQIISELRQQTAEQLNELSLNKIMMADQDKSIAELTDLLKQTQELLQSSGENGRKLEQDLNTMTEDRDKFLVSVLIFLGADCN